jgi:hypothetical protein
MRWCIPPSTVSGNYSPNLLLITWNHNTVHYAENRSTDLQTGKIPSRAHTNGFLLGTKGIILSSAPAYEWWSESCTSMSPTAATAQRHFHMAQRTTISDPRRHHEHLQFSSDPHHISMHIAALTNYSAIKETENWDVSLFRTYSCHSAVSRSVVMGNLSWSESCILGCRFDYWLFSLTKRGRRVRSRCT